MLNLTTLNRPGLHPDVARMVGDFTSTTLVRVGWGQAAFADRARAVQHEIWDALDHSLVSGSALVRLIRAAGRPNALAPVVLTSMLRGRGGDGPRPDPALRAKLVYGLSQTPQVVLDHQVSDHDGRLHLTWDFLAGHFEPGEVPGYFGRYLGLLRDLAADPSRWRE